MHLKFCLIFLPILIGRLLACGESEEEEVRSIMESMGRTLRVFFNSPSAITTDVVLGLIIANQLLRKSPHRTKWAAEQLTLQYSSEKLAKGFINNEFGNHGFSTELIPLILNSSLWHNIVQPLSSSLLRNGRNLHPSHYFRIYGKTMNERLSDECLSDLFLKNCLLSAKCIHLYEYGTQNGFGKTHFLLFLQVASVLNCPLKTNFPFTEENLSSSRANLCRSILDGNLFNRKKEPKFMAELDLALEEIALCGAEGYIDFSSGNIRKRVSAYEQNGCFGFKDVFLTNILNKKKRTDYITSKGCHSHLTAVGFVSMATFLRTLLNECA